MYFPLKAMLWCSWSVWWTHLSLLSDDGWSLAKCIWVFMVTGILTLMLHTAVMGSQPATMGEVPCSCAQLSLSTENAPKAWQLGRAGWEEQVLGSSVINWLLQPCSFPLHWLLPSLSTQAVLPTCSSGALLQSCPAVKGLHKWVPVWGCAMDMSAGDAARTRAWGVFCSSRTVALSCHYQWVYICIFLYSWKCLKSSYVCKSNIWCPEA